MIVSLLNVYDQMINYYTTVDHFKIMYVVDGLYFLMEPGELWNYFRQASQSIKEYVQVLITYKGILFLSVMFSLIRG